MTYKYDFLVIGSGIGGMSYALKVADKGTVALICKTELEEANTYYAQGGIASVTNTVVDNFKKHIEDTLIAGDGHCKRSAVEKVVLNAPKEIEELLRWGVDFDKDEKGDFDLHREEVIRSTGFCITKTTLAPRFRKASSRKSSHIRTSASWTITLR